MLTNLKSITFFYPSKIIGGAEFLYIRLAKYIASNTNIKVFVIDFEDGFLSKSLSGTEVKLLNYTRPDRVVIDYETTIITPFNHLFTVTDFVIKHQNSRVLFWSIHPTHFTSFFSNRNWFLTTQKRKRIANALDFLMENQSMVYMDSPNFEENKTGVQFNTNESTLKHLPICCDQYNGDLHLYSNKQELNICWLGRIAHDKVQAIENFVGHLSRLPQSLRGKIKFVVIGNGDEDKRLDSFLTTCGIKFERKHTITGDELNSYLINNIDLGVAMGTSLLEFAKLCIPVVTVDIMGEEEITTNKFQWLFETKGFSMGRLYKNDSQYTHTIEEMIGELSHPETYALVANKCLNYYQKNHSLPAISAALINMASEAKLTIKHPVLMDLEKLMNPWYFKLLKQLKNSIN